MNRVRAGRHPGAMRTVVVHKDVAAPPAALFALLTDPHRHADLDGSGMLRGRPEGPRPLALGDRFSMGMRQGGIPYRSVNTVVEYETDRLLAWETWGELAGRRLVGGQRWRYGLQPLESGGTRVTHTYDWRGARFPRLVVELPGYPARMGPAMTRTLSRLAAYAEGPADGR